MEVHETHERIQHSHEQGNKRVALLIVVLAALLAITEMGGKGAQNHFTAKSIEANDLWAFYQAKTIRQTTIRTTLELAQVSVDDGIPTPRGERITKKIKEWKDVADRLDEDQKGEGRRQLVERAHEAEAERDHVLASYHAFEYAAAAYQLAIVLASAAVITTISLLAVISCGLGLVATALSAIGFLAPNLLHF
jgi:fructose-specific phosphotransferase system component IIB